MQITSIIIDRSGPLRLLSSGARSAVSTLKLDNNSENKLIDGELSQKLRISFATNILNNLLLVLSNCNETR